MHQMLIMLKIYKEKQKFVTKNKTKIGFSRKICHLIIVSSSYIDYKEKNHHTCLSKGRKKTVNKLHRIRNKKIN